MQIEIKSDLTLLVAGFGGIAANKKYGATAFSLMDKMWPVIREKGLKHKGQNIWVYEPGDKVFAGVELDNPSVTDTGLEQKTIHFAQYAYCKHVGPYNMIGKTGDAMRNHIQQLGLKTTLPYIEIYGHWTNDEAKLETELLMALE